MMMGQDDEGRGEVWERVKEMDGADIEIVGIPKDLPNGSVFRAASLRINGQEIVCPNAEIVVTCSHLKGGYVTAQLTLMVKSLVIRAENVDGST
jgi:hypothetical protein